MSEEYHDIDRLIDLLVEKEIKTPLPINRQPQKEDFDKVMNLVKSHGQDVLKPLAELDWVYACAAAEVMLTHMMVIIMRSGRVDPNEVMRLINHNVLARLSNMQTILSAPQGHG
jgi:hypothetical protein